VFFMVEKTDSEMDDAAVSWRVLYALVLGELAALVGLFYALTWWAS
jgi:hypothetical protein